ncbi:MAG TPA: hypothetical protein VKZ63_17035 [Kofleriaceae bacterium]|nr:hypothetical protein [Kofleriaceae bacterium]
MAITACPICASKQPPNAMRCQSCGADFADPDVRALGGEAAAVSMSTLGAPGALSASRFLGFSLDGAVAGGAARPLALVGAGVLAAGFLAPLTIDFAALAPTWKALDGGPAAALLYPLVAAVAGLVLALAPVPAIARSAALAGLGLAGLASLPWLGRFAGAPQAPLALAPLFLCGAAAAVALRLHDPGSKAARRALAISGGLAVAALLVPMADAWRALPVELRFYLGGRDALDSGTTAGAFAQVINRDPNVLFVCLWAFMPFALVAGAIALAWPRPRGVWDTFGKILRPVGWAIALYLPIAYLLGAINLAGWDAGGLVATGEYVTRYENFVKTTMAARTKLAVLATGFSLWAVLGALPLLARLDRRR